MPRNGSETSSTPGTSPEATLTSGALQTCEPTTSEATPRPISSPASADGQSPSVSPAGLTTDLFGQALAPASHSLPQARARRPMTSATCGLRGFLSSPSAALQSSLESRLRRRLDGVGSTLFSLTWKAKATPAGRPYFQLAASGHRTSDNAFGSWPTPDTMIGPHGARGVSTKPHHQSAKDLQAVARSTAAWPTPMAGTPAQKGYNAAGNTDSSRKMAALAPWATPRSSEAGPDYAIMDRERSGGLSLQTQAAMAFWPTPNAMEGGQTSRSGKRKDELLLGGLVRNGLSAQTEKPGQLDPEFPCWLMGYEREHLNCAPTETRSSRKSQRSLSKP